MTASLPSVQPAAQSAGPQPAAPQEAAPEVPFSQVLSGEMAQQRRAEAAGKDAAPADEASTAAPAGADPAHARAPASGARSGKDGKTADEDDATQATPALPDAMLALALHPDMLKPAAPAATGTAPADAAARAGDASAPGLAPIEAAQGKGAGKADLSTRAASTSPAALPDARSVRADGKAPPADADALQAHAERLAANPEKTPLAEALAQRSQTAAGGENSPISSFVAAMAAAQTAQVAGAAVADLKSADRLGPAVGTSSWNQALGDKLVWMASGGQQSASLTLNPPDLGPLQVVVNVTNDQATASFFAHQPEVRQALETALPRLREMMQDAGIQLGQATVSADTPRQQDMPERSPQRASAPFPGAADDTAPVPLATIQPVRSGRGLVDTFA